MGAFTWVSLGFGRWQRRRGYGGAALPARPPPPWPPGAVQGAGTATGLGNEGPACPSVLVLQVETKLLRKRHSRGRGTRKQYGTSLLPQSCQPPSPERHSRPGQAEAGALRGTGWRAMPAGSSSLNGFPARNLSPCPGPRTSCRIALRPRGSGHHNVPDLSLRLCPVSQRRGHWPPTLRGSESWPGGRRYPEATNNHMGQAGGTEPSREEPP